VEDFLLFGGHLLLFYLATGATYEMDATEMAQYRAPRGVVTPWSLS
jgi:hypothetical protein